MPASILIVDDRPNNRDYLATLLGYKGYRLLQASDGAEALATALAEHPDVVITDVLMPTMDGYELVRRLRASPSLSHTVVVFYTAHYHGPEAEELARNCGVRHVLIKPCEPQVILDTIEQALASRESDPTPPPEEFDRVHLQLITDKLSENVDELLRTSERLRTLIDVNLQLGSEHDPRRLLDSVCDAARELLGARYALLAVGGKDGQETEYWATSGMDAALMAQMRGFPLHQGLAGDALRHRETLRAIIRSDHAATVGLPSTHPSINAVIVAPVVSLSHAYGWIALGDKLGADRFTEEDERLVGILGAQLGRTYENGSLVRELQASEAGLRHAERMAKLAHVITGPDGAFETWSDTLPPLAGLGPDELPRTTRDWLGLLHEDDKELFRRAAIQARTDHAPLELEYRLHRPGGAVIHVRQSLEPLNSAGVDGGSRWFNTIQDISDQKRSEDKIKRLNRVYAVLSAINSAIVRIHDRQVLFREACRIAVVEGAFKMAWVGEVDPVSLGGTVVAAHGTDNEYVKALRFSGHPDSPLRTRPAGRAIAEQKLVVCNDVATEDTLTSSRVELLQRGHNSLAVFPLVVNGRVEALLSLHAGEAGFFDDQELRLLNELAGDVAFALLYIAKDQELAYLAYYDAVSGLPNSTLFRDRLVQVLGHAEATRGTVALYLLDLDHFTHVNDTLGRATGDMLLKLVGERLGASLPKASSLARVSGDTFAIVIGELSDDADTSADILENHMFRALGEVTSVNGHELRVSARAGIALFPADAGDADALFKHAEAALRQAKASGDKYVYYAPAMNTRMTERLALEGALRVALDHNELVLHFQPKVDMSTGNITSCEALLRWQHPSRGLLGPSHFIAIAEDSDIIIPIGDWVMRTACVQMRAWQLAGLPKIAVSVNLSTRQFRDHALQERVIGALRDSGLDPACLELELTENIVMDDAKRLVEKLVALKSIGVKLSLDDFGTGFSSLSYLKRFPLDSLKVDQSFIRDVTTSPDDAAIVRAIISVGHSLGLDVVAEGVETEPQVEWLRRERCEHIQGFYFSPAVPADEFAQMLKSRKMLAFRQPLDSMSTKTLLIVDDEPSIVASLSRLLRRDGYNVLTAFSAADALKVLALNVVHVIVSDHRMPMMTGADFLGKVKALYPETVRILFSGYIEMEALADAVNRGAVYRFMLKPWDDEELRAAIREAFHHYWLTRQDGVAARASRPNAGGSVAG